MRKTMLTARQDQAKGFSLPPPVGGWNTRDPLANMSEKDAIYLENWIPQVNSLELRKGSLNTGTLPTHVPVASPHDIRTLIPYAAANGTQKLLAVAADGFYDVTTALTDTTHTYTTPDHALTCNPEWQFVNAATAGGHFVLAVNGAQAPVLYDGSSFVNLSGVSTPPMSGSGLTLANLVNVSLFKGRVILTEKDSLSFWYTAPNAIAGSLTEFPLAVLFRKGGYLMATAAWTLDSGSGPEDRFVALTSEGEVAIYAGTNPASASEWALVGVFELAKPLGRRCMCKVGGDLAVLTEDGILSLSKALPSATPAKSAALSDKISPTVRSYVDLYKSYPGWAMHYHAAQGLLLVNVPEGTGLASQLVMNTQTGAWTRFVGWNASSLCVCNSKLYFAAYNQIYHALYGNKDGDAAIRLRAKTAFMGNRGRFQGKRVTLYRLNLTTNAVVALLVGVDADYASAEYGSSSTSLGPDASLWNTAVWNSARWDISSVQAQWQSVAHMPGSALALRISAQLKNMSLTWNAIDFIVVAGGVL